MSPFAIWFIIILFFGSITWKEHYAMATRTLRFFSEHLEVNVILEQEKPVHLLPKALPQS